MVRAQLCSDEFARDLLSLNRNRLKRLARLLKQTYYSLKLASSGISGHFDRDFYLQQYPDVAGSSMDAAKHYLRHGRHEGRLGKLPPLALSGSIAEEFDPAREAVLVVSHEASRTGAPILSLNIVRCLTARYNVVVLLLGGGPLISAFRELGAVIMGPCDFRHNPVIANLMMAQLIERCHFKFALVNSIESRVVLPILSNHFVPSLSLLHEFAAYTRPRDAFREALFWSGDAVFSADLTLQSALAEYPDLGKRAAHIIPQGRCFLPTEKRDEQLRAHDKSILIKALRPSALAVETFLVVGAGFVQMRKGVDLFIECASRTIRSSVNREFRFVWIGKGYDPDCDVNYSVYLADQISRAGLERHVVFIDETAEIETVYAQADLLLLTSRLDPLPNVAIDALSEGVPVVCFDKTTGIADFLAENGMQESCVAGYLDTADMAQKVLQLASDRILYERVAKQSRAAAIQQFDMERYVGQLEGLADIVAQRMRQEAVDVAEIARANMLRQDFFSLPHLRHQSREEAIRGYVRAWACGIGRRKAFPGFHPGIYLEQHGIQTAGADPLADFLRSGQPEGPWLLPVITPQSTVVEHDEVKIALHLHVYYPELLSEILARLLQNKIRPDLFVSVPSEQVHQDVTSQLANYSGRVIAIKTVPNRGRDIGPFLTAFGPQLSSGYAIVGHLHTKVSADVKDLAMGRSWYLFLLENLLGGKSGVMADRIVASMELDPSIGMVFPDDPNVIGWGANKPFAEDLASKLAIQNLPEHIVFPVGTMFWARAKALAPMWSLGLSWDDYPDEPLPYDGSSLHAIERLFPLSLAGDKTRCAVTNVVGMTR